VFNATIQADFAGGVEVMWSAIPAESAADSTISMTDSANFRRKVTID